jgi:hypothetical protein
VDKGGEDAGNDELATSWGVVDTERAGGREGFSL